MSATISIIAPGSPTLKVVSLWAGDAPRVWPSREPPPSHMYIGRRIRPGDWLVQELRVADEVALEEVDVEGFHRARVHFVLDALGDHAGADLVAQADELGRHRLFDGVSGDPRASWRSILGSPVGACWAMRASSSQCRCRRGRWGNPWTR